MNTHERQDLISWTDDAYIKLEMDAILQRSSIGRMREHLGGSHSVVTYPPLDALLPLDASAVLNASTRNTAASIYVHVAFCEFGCPFCHYDTEVLRGGKGRGRTEAYMTALHSEMDHWFTRLAGSPLRSFYLGGGTPTALDIKSLSWIVGKVLDQPRTNDFIACVETSPVTITGNIGLQKLRVLADLGVKRISIGVQSFDNEMLSRSRGHEASVVRSAIHEVSRLVDNVNIDLIQDLPGQTESQILGDLDSIERFRPAQVTWYIMRLRPESAWYPQLLSGKLCWPTAGESARRRLMIIEGMHRIGYTAMPGGRFVRAKLFRDVFKDIRSGLDEPLIGIGLSAYSHAWGFFFRNTRSRAGVDGVSDYSRRISTSGTAIVEGLQITDVEQLAGAVISGIRNNLVLPNGSNLSSAAREYLTDVQATIGQMECAGLIERDSAGSIQLTRAGRVFEEEICASLYSASIKKRLTSSSPQPIALL